MRFVIVGAGRVGLRTGRALEDSSHEVVLVECDATAAERARKEGFDVLVGDGSLEETLLRTDLEAVDALGALTGDLNDNFTACLVANQYGCRTVMRIDEDYREDIYRKYADQVDEIVYPERLGAAGAKTALLGGDFNVVADLAANLQLTVLEIREGSPAVGKRMSELELPESARIYAHGRAREPLTIPLPGTEFEVGDEVAVITETDRASAVRSALLPASA